jgi:hypothetical protein
VCLGCLDRIPLFSTWAFSYGFVKILGLKVEGMWRFKRAWLFFFFKIMFVSYGCYLVVNVYEDVKDYELSVFSKVGQTFISSLHLNSKEPNLESELLLPSSGTFWGLSIFWV